MKGRQLRILLIGNNIKGQDQLIQFLEHAFTGGNCILYAEGLQQAEHLLEKEKVDIAFLDIGQAESQDLEDLLDIHRQFPSLPIIILTESEDMSPAAKAIQYGAQDCLERDQLATKLIERSIFYAIEQNELFYQCTLVIWELQKAMETLVYQQIEVKKALLGKEGIGDQHTHLANGTPHQFRVPLSIIQSNCDRLAKIFRDKNLAPDRTFARMTYRTREELGRVIDNLLKIDEIIRNVEAQKERVDLSTSGSEIMGEARQIYPEGECGS